MNPIAYLQALPLPVYVTPTNYDRFMVQAIEKRREKDKNPTREFCHWNRGFKRTIRQSFSKIRSPNCCQPGCLPFARPRWIRRFIGPYL